MCLGKIYCKCHLIQPAIEKDRKSHFKVQFFDQRVISENYQFLKSAYLLLSNTDSKALRKLMFAQMDELIKPFQETHPDLSKKELYMLYYPYTLYEVTSNSLPQEQEQIRKLKRLLFRQLKDLYINADAEHPLNLPAIDRIKFHNAYVYSIWSGSDEAQKHLDDHLKRLVKKIEQICYPSLEPIAGFDEYLDRNSSSPACVLL